MRELHNTRIGIIGTVGVPACYGGFETLAQQLVLHLQDRFNMTVYCSGRTTNKEDRPRRWEQADLVYIPLKANGPQSIFYDLLSMLHALFFCDVLLVLGVSGCFFLPLIKFFSKKSVLVNVDGLEWRRPKWNRWARRFLILSEWMATRYADEIITDNAALQKYILDRYGRYSRLITYGADHVKAIPLSSQSPNEYPFLGDEYAFKVCRIEPENMIDMVLDAFARQESLPLVLVGNWNHSEYGKKLRQQYQHCEHLYLLDPIYDPSLLNLLRSNCSVYIHGHSAGGTNPSLVEAMYLGLPIFAYDVIYNRITTHHQARYFANPEALIALLLDRESHSLQTIAHRMQAIAYREYTWSHIATAYAEACLGEVAAPIPSFDFELPSVLQSTF